MIKDMLPDWKDVTDARDAFRYYLGYSDQRPLFGRFSYAEKMEYWALVWGMFVMASTGLMIWFKGGVGERVPGWWIDVAITIHFYEAVLATLAIVVWHWYGVIFDPDAYPMNWSWFDGKMSIEQYQHEHPLDLVAIEKSQGSEEEARTGTSRSWLRGARRKGRQSQVMEPGGTVVVPPLSLGFIFQISVAMHDCDGFISAPLMRLCTRVRLRRED